MSEKRKFPHAAALAVAEELQAMLAPACQRIAIAGSLRRLKPEVGDIELLFIPRLSERPDGLFDNRIVDVCGEVVDDLQRKGVICRRPNVNGAFTLGERNKLAIHVPSGIPVDLFGTSEANWWVSLVVRTGSKETNLALTMGANKQGASLKAYGSGVEWSDGTITPATSEQHVFEMCGVPYKEPSQR
jgi:DNA polymerase (family 10)